MTLDEAIKHCIEVAEEQEQMAEYDLLCTDQQKQDCKECASEHRQLAEWLRELQELREDKKLYFDKAFEYTKWISCSERLPETDRCYLVTTTGTNNDIIDIAYYTKGIWHKASRIIAWMPLPKPYEEVKADEFSSD